MTQDNPGKKTPGVDGVAKLTPQERVDFVPHLHLQGDASPVRRGDIPKPGTPEQRPLGMPPRADRAKQAWVKHVVEPAWEAPFEPNSDGFRPGRSPGEAIGAIDVQINQKPTWVLEADIATGVDRLDPEARLRQLNASPTLSRQIKAWLTGGLRDQGVWFPTEAGTPPGGPRSPGLANVYLHDALDLWVAKVVTPHGRGEALSSRDADDLGGAFRFRSAAGGFYQALPKRRGKFNREGAPEKPRSLRVSRLHPGLQHRFTFVGFEFFWKADRQGGPRVKGRPARKKLQSACRRIKEGMRANRHLPGQAFFTGRKARLRGHDRDDGVHGNSNALYRGFDWAMKWAGKWLNRRGGNRQSCRWKRFTQILDAVPIARPRMTEVRRRRVFACTSTLRGSEDT